MTSPAVKSGNPVLAGICAAIISCAMVPLGFMATGTDQALGWGVGLLIFFAPPIVVGCLIGMAILHLILMWVGPRGLLLGFLAGFVGGWIAAPVGIAVVVAGPQLMAAALSGGAQGVEPFTRMLELSLVGAPGGAIGGFILKIPRRG